VRTQAPRNHAHEQKHNSMLGRFDPLKNSPLVINGCEAVCVPKPKEIQSKREKSLSATGNWTPLPR